MPAIDNEGISMAIDTDIPPIGRLLIAPPAKVHEQKLKTPMIAGSVCGGVIGIAWIIGFTIYFRKRYRRKMLKRRIAQGKAVQKVKPSKIPDERIIVPPDPAVLFGYCPPGEHALRVESVEKEQTDSRSDSNRNGTVTPLDDVPYATILTASEERLISRES